MFRLGIAGGLRAMDFKDGSTIYVAPFSGAAGRLKWTLKRIVSSRTDVGHIATERWSCLLAHTGRKTAESMGRTDACLIQEHCRNLALRRTLSG